MSETAGSSSTPARPVAPKRRVETRRAVLGLGLASAIVGGAWYIGGRSGFDQIGRGGENQDLLPKVGQQAPDFTAVSLSADVVSLSDYRGKPVWLNFWGSWCPPCRAEMPDIQAAYEQLAPKGLVLLAVSLGDAPDQAAQFAARNHVTFTVLLDPNRTLTSKAYPIFNFPTHIFIDESGTVRKIVLSEMSADQAIANAESILPKTA
ncbi:MAG TPA: TlpA disulfide reductase family protein [Thermomicrobiales bacterium]|jgi:peroxiredoxin